MIIDCHTHIFPEFIKKNRQDYFHLESEFRLLYQSQKSKIDTLYDLLKSMDENRIEKSIVFGFPWNLEENAKIHNDYILDAASKNRDRLIPFSCFNPIKDYAFKEAKRCLDLGFSGFGELGIYKDDFTDLNLIKIRPVMDIAKEKSIPIIFHTNEPCGHIYPGKAPISLKGIESFIQSFKGNKIILAHLGGGLPFYSLLKKPPNTDNIIFDIAAVPFIYKKNIYQILEKIGLQDKIVFGSDSPLISPKRYIKEIDESLISKEFRDKIFYKNIKNFLKH